MIESNFQKRLEELNNMAEKIKDPNTSLEDSIKCYEEGIEHYKICIEILEKAKQKIEVYGR